jgi:amino acid permease
MIQRIQSVYILIATLLAVLMLFLPWVTYNTESTSLVFSVFGEDSAGTKSANLLVSIAISVVLSLVSLFLFSDRKKQMKLVRFTMIFMVLTFINFGVLHYLNIENIAAEGELSMSYGISPAFILVNLVLLWLANKAIKKDDDLIRSVERLR